MGTIVTAEAGGSGHFRNSDRSIEWAMREFNAVKVVSRHCQPHLMMRSRRGGPEFPVSVRFSPYLRNQTRE